MRSFVSKLNIRQLIIHFIACWLFLYAIHTLATLYDYLFLYATTPPAMGPMLIKQKYDTDMLIITEAGYVGLIVAYIISWRISVKHQWFWINSVIVFLVIFVLAFFDRLGWGQLRNICMAPGLIFGKNTKLYLITDVAIMLAVGSFLFFNKWIISFIDKGVRGDKKVGAKKVAPASSKPKK